MKKHELIAEVSRLTGASLIAVRAVLETTADVTRDALARGQDVRLFGLGKLSVVKRGEKAARNIHTGDPVTVPPRYVPVFRPSESVISAANTRPLE